MFMWPLGPRNAAPKASSTLLGARSAGPGALAIQAHCRSISHESLGFRDPLNLKGILGFLLRDLG